jgi:hypothetical protein
LTFITSAVSLSSAFAWSACSGRRQTISPVAEAAAPTAAAHSSSSEKSPACVLPSAVMIAPVSVAMSTSRLTGKHVLRRADDRDDAQRQLQLGDRLDRPEHRRATRHVELHLEHLVGGLDRDPAGVERDGLADEPEHGPGRVAGGRVVSQRDERRLLV